MEDCILYMPFFNVPAKSWDRTARKLSGDI